MYLFYISSLDFFLVFVDINFVFEFEFLLLSVKVSCIFINSYLVYIVNIMIFGFLYFFYLSKN